MLPAARTSAKELRTARVARFRVCQPPAFAGHHRLLLQQEILNVRQPYTGAECPLHPSGAPETQRVSGAVLQGSVIPSDVKGHLTPG